MALSYIWKLQRLWPFSSQKDELRVSDDLVKKLSIPEQTKQFVFALPVPESESVVYILTTQRLSERSALDTDCLIREVHPDAVVAQVGSTVSSELVTEDGGNGTDEPFPTSAFRVLLRCFVDKFNKEKYEDAAANFVLREIFGTSFHGNFFAAKKAAEEVGCSFLMLESPYVKKSSNTSCTKKNDAENSFPGFMSSLVARKAADSGVSSNLRRFCLTDSVQTHMVKMVSSYMDVSASISSASSNLSSEGVELQAEYEPPPFAQSIYPLLVDLQNIFKDIPSVGRALTHAQKLLFDVNRGGEAVDAQILSEVYSFRVAVEVLRIALNNSGRLPITKIKDSSNVSEVGFSELSLEERAHALFAQALQNQAKKFKTIVAVVDASALSGLRKHWNTPLPKEVEDMVEQIVTEDVETSNDQLEKKRLLSGSSVVAVGAGATAVVGASSLSKVVPASTVVKMVTLNVPASFKIMASQTQKVIAMALGKSLGPTKVIAPGLASASKTSSSIMMKASLSAEKMRAVAHGVIASAEKTSISAMRTSFYEIMRKRRRVGPLPWVTFGCSMATCVGLLSYGDGIECAAESLPSAPSIAILGRGIQRLHQASEAVRQTDSSSSIQKSIEALMFKLKKGNKLQ